MKNHQQTVLRSLLSTPGPSGFEQTAARIWREEAGTFAHHVDHDVLGNSYAFLNRAQSPLIVIEGHIDEIGFIITYIDDEGFVWFDKIGGWDDQVIVGQRVSIAGASDTVAGVIGKKAAHLLKPADRERVTQSDDLWIDIGARSRADAEARVTVGDPVVLDVPLLELSDDLWVSGASTIASAPSWRWKRSGFSRRNLRLAALLRSLLPRRRSTCPERSILPRILNRPSRSRST